MRPWRCTSCSARKRKMCHLSCPRRCCYVSLTLMSALAAAHSVHRHCRLLDSQLCHAPASHAMGEAMVVGFRVLVNLRMMRVSVVLTLVDRAHLEEAGATSRPSLTSSGRVSFAVASSEETDLTYPSLFAGSFGTSLATTTDRVLHLRRRRSYLLNLLLRLLRRQ